MKQFFKTHRGDVTILLAMILAGQLIFLLFSHGFTTPRYEGRVFATTGVKHKQEDLHKLNEAAHYFGQTIIGWLKFPNFFTQLNDHVELPSGSSVSAHIQERQNIIFSVKSPTPLKKETLIGVKDFIQEKISLYNADSLTEFVLTNLDYELVEMKRSYRFGVGISLLASLVIGAALIFLRREFSQS